MVHALRIPWSMNQGRLQGCANVPVQRHARYALESGQVQGDCSFLEGNL